MSRGERWQPEVGTAGSRYRINTPSLVLDLDRVERNLALMAGTVDAAGKQLRPHAKSHKCSRIAAMQRRLGAVGICCATLDEAEAMTAAGIDDIVITSPIVGPEKIARLVALVARAPATMVVVDSPRALALLAGAARHAGQVLNLLVDIELGFGRTGVVSCEDALFLTEAILATPGVRFAGLQAYGGHLQHIADYPDRRAAARHAGKRVREIAERVRDIVPTPFIVSGGGTGTHAIDAEGDWFTEIQAGSYPLMDVEYGAIAYAEDGSWPFAPALFVQTMVVSANIPGSVTVDAGTKAVATNGPAPRLASAAHVGAVYEFSGDEHGRIRLSAEVPPLQLGDRIELVASHCDPTVALHDVFHCVRGDRLVDIWPIDARGRL